MKPFKNLDPLIGSSQSPHSLKPKNIRQFLNEKSRKKEQSLSDRGLFRIVLTNRKVRNFELS